MIANIELKTADIVATVEPMQTEVQVISASVLSMRNEVHRLFHIGKYFFLTHCGSAFA